MKVLDHFGAASKLATLTGRPVLYLRFIPSDTEKGVTDLVKAAPYLSFGEHSQAFADGCAFVIAEDEQEAKVLFRRTVGDDGPSRYNRYDGPTRVYSMWVDAHGHIRDENT